ncbi:MAG TPA: alpha/beta fold hydrolase, partial [Candidatus Woesebacteria bacterium]|nr:alpha/beta fold hydrolase [Candidatus Woesebacteria bacterium]
MENSAEVPAPLEQPARNNIWWIIGGILLAIISSISIYYFQFGPISTNTLPQGRKSSLVQAIISPTPMPFEEMTIPALRKREYKSNLGERTTYSQHGNYTSYLTSYNSDGLKINGLLTIPTGEEPKDGWPAIIFIHGYIPPTVYQTTERYVDYVNYLASNGFVVFKIDLRGHGHSEGEATGAYFSSDYIIDALTAYSALQNSNFVNQNKIGLWGHSMAGNVILRTMTVKTDIPAAVIWAGAVYSYTDREEYGIQDTSYRPPPQQNITQSQNRRQRLFDTYGDFDQNNEFWSQFSAVNY